MKPGLVLSLLALASAANLFADDARRPVDPCVYPNDAAARAAWKPMEATADVAPADVAGRKCLRMPCNFAKTSIERASWDREIRLDLTNACALAFDVRAEDVSSVSHFSIYLRSGGGWYRGSFAVASRDAWTPVTIEKSDLGIEGTPAGWASVDSIRISAWRGGDKDGAFFIAGIEAVPSSTGIVVVRGESAAKSAPDEVESVCQFAGSMSRRLDELGLGFSMMSDLDLTPARLKDTSLVVLPHDPVMAPAAVATLDDYLKRGGKLLAFYSLPDRLQKTTGIETGQWIGEKSRGQFARIVRSDMKSAPGAADLVANFPPESAQASWNIKGVKVAPGRGFEVAHWADSTGKDAGLPAVVAGTGAMFMTHVLLDDDLPDKRMMLLAMAGHLVPDLWRRSAEASVERMGRMGPHKDIKEAAAGPGAALARQAESERDAALQSFKSGDFAGTIRRAERGRDLVLKAWCSSEKPLAGERRLVWCHNPLGPAGMTWDASAKVLAENGFTDLIVNVAWAGSAAYKSEVLPLMTGIEGDPLAECVAACHKCGLKVHAWKVNWTMGWRSPKDFMERMRREGRVQLDAGGKQIEHWLCPSNLDNRKMDVESMVELATKHGLDGIHFDYIRYPGPEGCFCPGCRERFEKLLGRPVAHWPHDVQSGVDRNRWLDFRRDNINADVSAVAERVRRLAPGVKISAAVFPNWPVDRDGVGQDWALWCEKGWVDFVCPMNYTSNTPQFDGLVDRQRAWAGKVPFYPGIGLSTWPSRDLFMLFDQVNVTRRLRTGGFTIFEYSSVEAKDVVPLLGLGITRKSANP